MTVREFLTASVPYQIPDATLNSIGEEVGLEMDTDMTEASPVEVNRSRARLYIYLATVPNVSEGGVSISFTAVEKKMFLDLARKYAGFAGETGLVPGASYGYKGQNI